MFAECSGLKKIIVKSKTVDLSNAWIEKLENLSIYGYVGSKAQEYADISGIPFYNLETGERVITEFVVVNDGDANALVRYNGSDKEIVVPGEVNGMEVQAVDSAFAGSDIVSISFPESVKRVYSYAFENCAALRSVSLSKGMTQLNKVFQGCTALTDIYIPSSVTFIYPDVFADCPDVVIHCESGSYAAKYAEENGIEAQLVAVCAPAPTPTHTP